MKNCKSHSPWLARFDRKIPFHFPRVFPMAPDRSQNGKHSLYWGKIHHELLKLEMSALPIRYSGFKFHVDK